MAHLLDRVSRRCSGALLTALSLMAWLVMPCRADAAPYPTKQIKIVSSYSPGGGNDLIARAVAARLSVYFKQSVVVENRDGGGGNIGVDYVAKAAPDGYTLLVTAQSLTMRPALFAKLPFDVKADFAPVGIVGSFPILFLTKPGAGFKDIGQLIAFATAHPGQVTYATPGVGTTQHVAMELFKSETRTDLTHIPYRGASKAVTDVIAGDVAVLVSTPSTVMPFVQTGKLLLLGTGEPARVPSLGNGPTIGETVKDFQVNNWLGVMAPAATPRDVLGVLDRALVAICKDPLFISQLAASGFVVRSQDAVAMARQVDSDLVKWGAIITTRHITPE